MKFLTILILLVLLTALSDAKKKGKKKSHKKKTSTTAAIESQKSTLFPKPDKKIVGDKSNEKLTTGNPGLTTTPGQTTEGSIGSTASVASTGPKTSVGLTGSTASVALTGSTVSVGSGLPSGATGLATLRPGNSTAPVNSSVTSLKSGKESTVTQTTVNPNITTTTLQSNTTNVNATTEFDTTDDDEMENEEVLALDTKSDEQFINEFRLSNDEHHYSKYEPDDYEVFITEPMPEYKRKKRYNRISNVESRKKRSNNVIEEENLGTTISGFKFTGGESQPSVKSIYKNINI